MATDTVTEPVTTAPSRVLVVDDERSMRELLSIVLKRDGYEVLVADDGVRAIELLKKQRVDILITDIRMPQMSGVDVLREAKNIDPEIISIVMTAFASTDTAVEALRLGAADYVHKSPSAANELRLRVRKELERKHLQRENVLLKRALQSSHKFSNIIGRSDPMLSVFQLIETIAPTGSTVLITGESGTGKELAARAIHFNSLRKERPFVALNCGALSETLLDSELFGHMKGSFTGADTNKKGLIEVAEKGSIFLDEIGEMSPLVQVKLLRVLQERKYRRLGGTEEVEADIRVIAATNRDLAKMVAEGTFREDLFYRINVIPIRLPALRERVEDIPLLADHFVVAFCDRDGEDDHRHLGSGDGLPAGLRLAREHPGAGERDRARGGARAHAVDSCREPARAGSRGGVRGRPARRRPPRTSPTTASISSSTSSTSSASTSPRRSGAPAA